MVLSTRQFARVNLQDGGCSLVGKEQYWFVETSQNKAKYTAGPAWGIKKGEFGF